MLSDLISIFISVASAGFCCIILYMKNRRLENKKKEVLAVCVMTGAAGLFSYFFLRFILFNYSIQLSQWFVVPLTIIMFLFLYRSILDELRVYEDT